MADVPEEYRKLWSEWEVRLLVILSFFLQIFLTMAAPLRRRDDISKWVGRLIWAAYLLADWVAGFALAMLADVVYDSSGAAAAAATRCDDDLIAFWAPFLLAHLGGPDTITALALEDNELWLRHLLTLGIHLVAATYVFLLTLPKNHLLAPTLLIFLVGIGRYVERTRALYLASSRGFSYWTMATYEKEDHLRDIDLPGYPEEGIDRVNMVKLAHRFFSIYSGLFVGRLLNFNSQRDRKGSIFQRRLRAKDAFRIIEVELDLAYDALYTKAMVINNRTGYILRAICFFSILIALAIFFPFHKCKSKPVDKAVTYLLLSGAAAIEVIALVNIIFSNWMPVSVIRALSKRICRPCGGQPKPPRHISQCNMLTYCLRSKSQGGPTWKTKLGIEDPIKKLAFTSKVGFSEELMNFILTELRKMSEEATDFIATRNVMSRRWDDFIIERITPKEVLLGTLQSTWLQQLNLDDSILIWHVTTDLCYYGTARLTRHTSSYQPDTTQKDMIKCISNYMFYLLTMHPSMLSTEEGSTRAKYQNMCKEALIFVPDHDQDMSSTGAEVEGIWDKVVKEMNRRSRFIDVGSMRIATALQYWVLTQPDWEVLLRRVWVNMFFHAASSCSGRCHAQRLVQGGELLTLVWFLMAHLRLTDHYSMKFELI